jgi:hypothetical protein
MAIDMKMRRIVSLLAFLGLIRRARIQEGAQGGGTLVGMRERQAVAGVLEDT